VVVGGGGGGVVVVAVAVVVVAVGGGVAVVDVVSLLKSPLGYPTTATLLLIEWRPAQLITIPANIEPWEC
jgi:hypothetical protein